MKTQNSKSKIQNIIILSAVCCLLSALFGCGYTLHSKTALPFHAIQIGIIENRTVEPKLQDKLYRALTDEFLKQGIAVYHGADYQLKGKINHFELRILSEKSDVATEYEVIMKGDFTTTGPPGYIKELKDVGSPFIISFSATDNLTGLLALKELASDRAIRDMAQQIVAALIYR
jgi:outer membrane lipopolysaccharide assembly protein LptE/RlpB